MSLFEKISRKMANHGYNLSRKIILAMPCGLNYGSYGYSKHTVRKQMSCTFSRTPSGSAAEGGAGFDGGFVPNLRNSGNVATEGLI